MKFNTSHYLLLWSLSLVLALLSSPIKANKLGSLNLEYRFHQLTNNNKFSNPVVYDIAQDVNGFIWVATADGLNRFDGQDVIVYRPSTTNTRSISHFDINKVLCDKQGILWAATEDGLNWYNSEIDSFELFNLSDKNQRTPSSSKIREFFEDSSSQLWFATSKGEVGVIAAKTQAVEYMELKGKADNQVPFYVYEFIENNKLDILIASSWGIFRVDKKSKTIQKVYEDIKHQSSKPEKKIKTLFQVSDNQILVGTKAGIYDLNPKTGLSSDFAPKLFSNKNITVIQMLDQQHVFVGTRQSGLYLVNITNKSTRHFKSDSRKNHGLIDNQINSIFRSKDGYFWIGTNLGISLFDHSQRQFGHYKSNSFSAECLSGNTVYAVLVDSKNYLWIASFGYALHRINLTTGQCQEFKQLSKSLNNNLLANVTAMYEDENSDIWIGTTKRGIFRYKQEGKIFEPVDTTPHFITSITGNKSGKVWFSTYYTGLFEYDLNQQSIYQFSPSNNDKPSEIITAINALVADKKENLWLSTNSEGLWNFNIAERTFSQILLDSSESMTIPLALRSINLDRSGNLWIGSKGEGVFQLNPNSKSVKRYSINNGLLNNVVMNIQQDNQGNMWFMTDKGLSRLSASDEKIHTFLEKDGMQADAFTTAGFFDSNSKTLWTGGIKGFNRFRPDDIVDNDTPKAAIITGFELFYKPVELAHRGLKSPLKKIISRTKAISLNHDQNVFSFSFSALEYLFPEQIKYGFMLDGYDLEWNYVNSERRYASYTNIPPGQYTFRVKASNKFGTWDENESKIKIDIAFPWWQTNIAYILYIIFTVTTIYLLIRFRTNNLIKRAQNLEISVTERTQELAKEKQKVEQLLSRKNEEFANVSHEFRTPLTLILGPLEQLLKKDLKPEVTKRLNIIHRNGYRLLRMVDQLLNLETFRINAITQKKPQAANKIIQLITEAFADLASEKNIEINIKNSVNVSFSLTPDALEKIILNLLSNAIKYTKPGGTISVETMRTNNNELKIRVKDSGIGIPKDKIDSVFERYSRILDENSEQVTGAGIGLALVKSLVESHFGRIELESEVGLGTKVDVYLPIIDEVKDSHTDQYSNNEIIAMELMSLTNQSLTSPSNAVRKVNELGENLPRVLVVEDNQDMRNFIAEAINEEYRVSMARDGKEGVKMAIMEIPDLIISDVMMPNMDGYEVTNQLRKNQLTNHIPIILLTARSDRESRLKGWYERADEYLTKPFDAEELKIRLNNLLEIRDILKRRFAERVFETRSPFDEQATRESTVEENKNKQQEIFITKINQTLEVIYSESETTIADFASKMAMSERQLLRKLKSVLDMTPAEYLRRFRLEKAKSILEQGKSAGIATFEAGFANQSHFSRCFKEQFGISPREYKKSLSQVD